MQAIRWVDGWNIFATVSSDQHIHIMHSMLSWKNNNAADVLHFSVTPTIPSSTQPHAAHCICIWQLLILAQSIHLSPQIIGPQRSSYGDTTDPITCWDSGSQQKKDHKPNTITVMYGGHIRTWQLRNMVFGQSCFRCGWACNLDCL